MHSGAVGALTKVKNAIGVAYSVLNKTKHSLLAGEEANVFANRMGFPMESLDSYKAEHDHRTWKLQEKCQPNFWQNVRPDSNQSCGPYSNGESGLLIRGPPLHKSFERRNEVQNVESEYDPVQMERDVSDLYDGYSEGDSFNSDEDELMEKDIDYRGEEANTNYNYNRILNELPETTQFHVDDFTKFNSHDSIGMIAIDANGNIAAGSSSNGRIHKIPGRVGSAAIVGASAFADSLVGAAIATGDGDIIQRFSPSALAVDKLRAGESAFNSAHAVLDSILQFEPEFFGAIIVVSKDGLYSAACSGLPKFPFTVMNLILKRPHTFWISCSKGSRRNQPKNQQ